MLAEKYTKYLQMTSKYNKSKIVKIYFMCLLSLLALFLGFSMNFWGVADQQWFDNHQRDSESLIIGRIVKSAQDGVLSSGGLTGIGGLGTIPPSFSGEAFEQQYNAYYTGQRFGAYTTYDSQIGGQGILFSILNENSIRLAARKNTSIPLDYLASFCDHLNGDYIMVLFGVWMDGCIVCSGFCSSLTMDSRLWAKSLVVDVGLLSATRCDYVLP